jgi:hypothetical protein
MIDLLDDPFVLLSVVNDYAQQEESELLFVRFRDHRTQSGDRFIPSFPQIYKNPHLFLC